MNVVTLIGRLTKDPEVRYTSGENASAICRYTIAVNRSRKREGEPDADFINIVAFGKAGEFAGKYFKKGMQVAVVGSIKISSFTDRNGNKKWSTDVVAREQFFAERKQEPNKTVQLKETEVSDDIPEIFKQNEQTKIEDALPF